MIIFQMIFQILRRWSYALIAVSSMLGILLILSIIPNPGLFYAVLSDGGTPIGEKTAFVGTLFLDSISFDVMPFQRLLLLLSAMLVGVNIALLAALFHEQRTLAKSGTTIGVLGFASGILGLGCASCGTLLIGGFLPFLFGAAIFPLGGLELSILGVVLLFVSTYMIGKQLTKSAVCPI